MIAAMAARRASTARVGRHRRRAFFGVAPALLALAACGGDGGAAPVAVDGATPDGGCAPQLSPRWAPTWKPPRATPHACTDAQIDTEFRLCENESTYSATDCAAFNRAAANAACRRCLYATEDESSYGPLVYLANRILRINVAGCLALADRNVSAFGCGAQIQAFDACGDSACMKTCPDYDGFTRCAAEAGETVCSSYRSDSACGEPAVYAPCLEFKTFEEYYRGVAKLFCAAGFTGGGGSDAGVFDAGMPDVAAEGGKESVTGASPASLFRFSMGRRIDRGEREMPAQRGEGEGTLR